MAMILDGSASVTINSGAILGITSGTAVASTSGATIDFTSIPAWVKRLTVLFSGVSTSGTNSLLIQLGSSGSVETTSYISVNAYCGATNAAGGVTSTAGFIIFSNASANLFYGHATFTLSGSNLWIGSYLFGVNNASTYYSFQGGGNKTTSAALDRVRITTVGGTDTFDAGTVNIMYEG